MMPFLNVFRKIGGAFDIDDEGIRFWHAGRHAAARSSSRPTSTRAS